MSEKPKGLGLVCHAPASYPCVIPLVMFFVTPFVTPFCQVLRHTLLSSPASYLRHTPASYPFVFPSSCLRYPFQVLVVRVRRACPFDVVVCGTLLPPSTVRSRLIGTHGDKEGLVMTHQHVQTLVLRMAPAKSHPPFKRAPAS